MLKHGSRPLEAKDTLPLADELPKFRAEHEFELNFFIVCNKRSITVGSRCLGNKLVLRLLLSLLGPDSSGT